MEKKLMLIYLCVILLPIMIPTSQGKFCSKQWHYYAAQHYCMIPWVWGTCFFAAYGYRRIIVYELGKVCCPGYNGKDCTNPICRKPCEPGYSCTSPDECTPDPNFVGSMIYNATNSTESTLSPNFNASVNKSESDVSGTNVESKVSVNNSEPSVSVNSTEPSVSVNSTESSVSVN